MEYCRTNAITSRLRLASRSGDYTKPAGQARYEDLDIWALPGIGASYNQARYIHINAYRYRSGEQTLHGKDSAPQRAEGIVGRRSVQSSPICCWQPVLGGSNVRQVPTGIHDGQTSKME